MMKLPADLPEGVFVKIDVGQNTAFIKLADNDGDAFSGSELLGALRLDRRSEKVWEANDITAVHGWGPFLMDLAMEWVYEQGGVLFPCPKSINDDAKVMWKVYGDPSKRADIGIRRMGDEEADRLGVTHCEPELRSFYTKEKTFLNQLARVRKIRRIPPLSSPILRPDWWDIVINHEGGHAVATLAIWGESADIFVREETIEADTPVLWASFRLSGLLKQRILVYPPMDIVRIAAAGAQAERLFCSVADSYGFATDFHKFITFAQARANHIGGDVASAVNTEIEDNYPLTRALVERYTNAHKAITDEAIFVSDRLRAQQKLVVGTTILDAARIKRLFMENPP